MYSDAHTLIDALPPSLTASSDGGIPPRDPLIFSALPESAQTFLSHTVFQKRLENRCRKMSFGAAFEISSNSRPFPGPTLGGLGATLFPPPHLISPPPRLQYLSIYQARLYSLLPEGYVERLDAPLFGLLNPTMTRRNQSVNAADSAASSSSTKLASTPSLCAPNPGEELTGLIVQRQSSSSGSCPRPSSPSRENISVARLKGFSSGGPTGPPKPSSFPGPQLPAGNPAAQQPSNFWCSEV